MSKLGEVGEFYPAVGDMRTLYFITEVKNNTKSVKKQPETAVKLNKYIHLKTKQNS